MTDRNAPVPLCFTAEPGNLPALRKWIAEQPDDVRRRAHLIIQFPGGAEARIHVFLEEATVAAIRARTAQAPGAPDA